MKSRAAKAHQSDDEEDEITQENQTVATTQQTLSQEEIERRQLENVPVIADSEISPAAYLFQNHEDQDDMNLFEQQSMKVKCPFCDAVSFSIVEYRTSFLGYLVAILSILIFGFMSIILMPFLVSLTKVALHRCAKCLNEVKSNSYFGFSSLEDKLLTFQLGKFGVVLTRRYLLYIVMTITCGLAIYLFVVNETGHNHDVSKCQSKFKSFLCLGPISELQWNDYRRDLKQLKQLTLKFQKFYYVQIFINNCLIYIYSSFLLQIQEYAFLQTVLSIVFYQQINKKLLNCYKLKIIKQKYIFMILKEQLEQLLNKPYFS